MTGPRFDDCVDGTALVFPAPERVVEARTPAQVRPALAAVEAATRAGRWAAGYVAYEAAAGFDSTLSTHEPGELPLLWFAIGGPPAPAPLPSGGGYAVGEWTLDRSAPAHAADVRAVQGRIAAGDTYQVNLTTRLSAPFAGAVAGLYADLARRQRGRHAALLDTGRFAIASASPELFFEWRGEHVLTRPMKGTAARGRTPAEDRARRADLLASAKERAENVIVVDLLRNDLGRVAEVGSVRVDALGRAERYETVWQLTSDVSGRMRPGTSVVDLFAALFPSGSVTGAPKPSTMRIIRDLEPQPRGVYCGAIGWLAPPGAPVRARFSVAIRTVVVDRAAGRATYGVGGGITAGSTAPAEWAELLAKAAVLAAGDPEFALFETMACVGGRVRRRAEHVARLAASADYYGFAFDGAAVARALDEAAFGDARLRLDLDRAGHVAVRRAALPAAAAVAVTLAVDPEPIDSTQPRWFHKTTDRAPYETRAARHRADDVVLVNERGHVTETTIANLAVRRDGRWWTPPLDDGLLSGIERAARIADGTLRERSLTLDDLRAADGLAVLNSLRGWRAAVLVAAARSPAASRSARVN